MMLVCLTESKVTADPMDSTEPVTSLGSLAHEETHKGKTSSNNAELGRTGP